MNSKIVSVRISSNVNDDPLNISIFLHNNALMLNFPSFEQKLHNQFPHSNIYYRNNGGGTEIRKYQKDNYSIARPADEMPSDVHRKVFIAFGEIPELSVKKQNNGSVDIHYPIAAFKADQPLKLSQIEIEKLKRKYGVIDRKKTVVFGSFGVGSKKETAIFQELIKLLVQRDDVQVLVVPRMIDDKKLFDQFKDDISKPVSVITAQEVDNEKNVPSQIIWVKQMGVLKELYFLSQYTFLGGTLEARSIQNPMEPARAGSIMFIGFEPQKYKGNNSQIIKGLASSDGVIKIKNGSTVNDVAQDVFSMMDDHLSTEVISHDLVKTADELSESMNNVMKQLGDGLEYAFSSE